MTEPDEALVEEVDDLIAFHATQTPVDSPDAPRLGASAQIAVQTGTTIRRLTPLERERLMDWPDEWTRFGVTEQGETVELSDSARDRLTGNGVVTAVAGWIADRIADVDVGRSTVLDNQDSSAVE